MHTNARLGGNHMIATPNRQRENETHFRNEGRIGNVQMREHRGFAEARTIGREGRYDRGYRGERREFYVGGGVAAAEYTYPRRLYAYAPGYDVGYRGRPFYSYGAAYGVTSYEPAYGVTVGADPSYAPAYDLAYSTGPYYGYAPGFNLGIGIGPVGLGIGPAWGW